MNDWQDDAECRNKKHHPEMWWSTDKDLSGRLAIQEALTICRTQCKVRAQCLNHALENDEDMGIWGGMTESERKKLHR